jgi:pimeloyl-ACP methyl ester carboxylesterase
MRDDVRPPETEFARAGSVMVAYQVCGDPKGTDVVVAPGTVSHLDLDWQFWPQDMQAEAEWWSSFCRWIRFDKRGTGLSDRGVIAATLEERTEDIRAVMDAAGSQRAFILGNSEGGCMACMFAATYPERTAGVILWGTMPRWVETDGYPWGFSVEDHDRVVAEMSEQGVTPEYLTGKGAGMPDLSGSEMELVLRYCRSAVSPTQAAALERMNDDMDIRAILGSIHAPTLVLNRRDDPCADIEAVRLMAGQMPNARLAEFGGKGHGYSITDPADRPIYDAIHEFITGRPATPVVDRVLTTILFTDIVGSTEQAAAFGDERWHRLLERHNHTTRSVLARYGGREVVHTGDGFLATFDGPGRAIRAGWTLITELGELGIGLRVGVHTGEVELVDGNIGGIAVHLCARIAALGGPSDILVTSTVKDLTAGSGITYDELGTPVLKGIPEQWHIFRALPPKPNA